MIDIVTKFCTKSVYELNPFCYAYSQNKLEINGVSLENEIQTTVSPARPCTGIGCDLGCVSPVPSCPYSLLPHAHKVPSSWRAKLWNAPTAISLIFSRPCTRTGTEICLL